MLCLCGRALEKWLRIGGRQSREAREVSSSENILLLLPQVASTSVQGVRIMSKFCFIEDDPRMVTTNTSNRIDLHSTNMDL